MEQTTSGYIAPADPNRHRAQEQLRKLAVDEAMGWGSDL